MTDSFHSYRTRWPSYALDWSPTSAHFCTLAVASFVPSKTNYFEVISLESPTDKNFRPVGKEPTSFDFVATKIQWAPSKAKMDLLAVSGDGLRIWRRSHDRFEFVTRLVSSTARRPDTHHQNSTNPPAPITSFDWCTTDSSLLVTASYDTTCTVWNLETGAVRTQLIAHDQAVFDVAFSPAASNSFVSVGADGSLRMFDIRSLDHSTILYETNDARQLIRVAWNTNDSNFLSCFAAGQSSSGEAKVQILDIRMPSIPVAELSGHDTVMSMRWAPHSSNHIMTCDESYVRLWDLSKDTREPLWAHGTAMPVQQIVWPSTAPDWICLGASDLIQVFKI